MGLSVIVLIILVVIFLDIKKTNRQRMNYMEERKVPTATNIKYDRRLMKMYTVAFVVIGSIFVISLILMNVEVAFFENSWLDKSLMVGTIYGLLLGGFLLIILAYLLLDGSSYIKRLKAYGYEIPYDKRQYAGMLEQLPRTAGEVRVEQDNMPAKNKISKALMGLCVSMGLVMLGLTIWYYHNWSFMGDDAMFMFVVQLVSDVLWICPIRLFYKQMDSLKYKDDVEIDASRKNRLQLVDGLILILVLAGVSFLVKNTAHNMSNYLYNTWMSQDEEQIGRIRDVFEVAYMDPTISKDDVSWKETMAALEEGVDITTWGVPEGEYQENVAIVLEITDFSALKSSFRSTDGPAIVYVKMENGNFVVELRNLHKVTDRVIRMK